MSGRRVVLNFDKEVYHRESKIWYFLDPIITPNIGKMVADVASKLNINEEQVCVFINKIIAPKWSSSAIICSEDDDVWIKSAPLPKEVPAAAVASEITVTQPLCASLTISNAMHKDFSKNTTPTHKDKYRNRSKVYVRPSEESSVSVPVVSATAVAAPTVSYVKANLKENASNLLQKVVDKSMTQTQVISNKVSQIVNDSSSEDSSMTDSSDDEETAPPRKVAKKDSSESDKEDVKRSESESEEEKQDTPRIAKNPEPSSSESDEDEPMVDKEERGSEESESEESGREEVKEDDEEKQRDYSHLQDLVGLPQLQDKLAFKMLDMNEFYCPVVSQYKEGIITNLDISSETITVKILRGEGRQVQKNGKFEIDADISHSNPTDIVHLNFRQMIDPKIITSRV